MNPTDTAQLIIADSDRYNDFRALLIDPTDETPSLNDADRTLALETIADCSRDELTALLLEFSLCPAHRIDYAICFDDDDPTCAQIRHIHPAHDS